MINLNLIISLLIFCGATNPDAGIIISQFSANPKVTNGCAYEKATMDISKYSSIIVPDNSAVQQGELKGKIEIYIEKELSFAGHPPSPMHIKDARNYMGCAFKEQNSSVIIGTFGEWSSKQGGAQIRMLVIVPKEINISSRPDISGYNSKAKAADDHEAFTQRLKRKCYWYTSISPAEGWQRIDMAPDIHLTAKKKIPNR